MTTQELSALIALGALVLALVFNLLGSRRLSKQDARQSAADTATVNVKLDGIGADVREIKADIRSVRDDVKELRERMAAVEMGNRQAHARLDRLENRKERVV